MGNADSRMNFRKAVIDLTSKKKPTETMDESFWEQFWSPDNVNNASDVFSLIPAAEIRALREESPNNLATLCYKAVERLMQAGEHSVHSAKEQQKVVNCIRLLTRILPYIFEDPDWRGYFWSALPADNPSQRQDTLPLAKALLGALTDLLFCPDFTVSANKKGPETPEDLASIDSCEYIWEAGVGFAQKPSHSPQHDFYRTEILKLLLAC
uniref:Protein HID1 n=1 Tax=Plectus sambesii TaxID=2011161 RepID=A0A914UZW0_9BILA